jgi:hypothetical protein
LQYVQAESHGVSQQTPSTQLPLWHWCGEVQVAPAVTAGTHVSPLQ